MLCITVIMVVAHSGTLWVCLCKILLEKLAWWMSDLWWDWIWLGEGWASSASSSGYLQGRTPAWVYWGPNWAHTGAECRILSLLSHLRSRDRSTVSPRPGRLASCHYRSYRLWEISCWKQTRFVWWCNCLTLNLLTLWLFLMVFNNNNNNIQYQ